VTVPQLGPNTLDSRLGFDLVDLQLQSEDLAFALDQMRKYPNVDTERVAVLGHSSGGLVGLMMATRNRNIDAVVGLDASFIRAAGSELLFSWPEFQTARLRLDLLNLYSAFDPERVSTSLMDTLAYCRRIHVGIDKATHFDFQNWPLYSVLTGIEDKRGVEYRTVEEGAQIYLAVCRETARFLDAVFYGGEEELWELVRQPVIPDTASFVMEYRVQAGKQVPFPEDVAQVFLDGKPWVARELIQSIREQFPDETVFTKREMDILASQLEHSGETEGVLTLLDLAVQFWPESVMSHYRFAEALLEAGQRDEARTHYRDIVNLLGEQELDPESVEAKVLQATEERMEELGPGESETEVNDREDESSEEADSQ